jgi:hypothetical protein
MDNWSSGDPYRRYLRLLGVPRRLPDLAALAELSSARLRRVPFQNLSKLYIRNDAPGTRGRRRDRRATGARVWVQFGAPSAG